MPRTEDCRVIAEVNGIPVLVETTDGEYEAPEGLEGVVAYLEAGGGLHDAIDHYRREG